MRTLLVAHTQVRFWALCGIRQQSRERGGEKGTGTGALLMPERGLLNSSDFQPAGPRLGRFKSRGDEPSLKRRTPAPTKH